MEMTLTERAVLARRMGRNLTDEELYERTPKRDRAGIIDKVNNSTKIYKECAICSEPICVNNWPDGKSRTPRIYDMVICSLCDPRHIDDRYMKKGYRIVNRSRLRVVNMARITRALARGECLRVMKGEIIVSFNGCNCAACAARKLWPGLQE